MGLLSRGISTYSASESLNQHLGDVINITPVISTSAYDAGDALFNPTEIPNAVGMPGGTSRLINVTVITLHDALDDIKLVFMQNGNWPLISSISPGSSGAPAMIDANIVKAAPLGYLLIDGSNSTADLGDGGVWTAAGAGEAFYPILLKGAEGSTSCYVAGIAHDAQQYSSTSDLKLVLHIEYR